MARNTPKKSNSNLEQEIQALKETKAGQFNYLNATSFLGNCSTVSVYKNVYGQSLLKLKIRLSMEGSLINFFLNCYTMGLIRLVQYSISSNGCDIQKFSELTKKLQNHEKELDMLRKELQDKTNCIQNLSKQIAPTPTK